MSFDEEGVYDPTLILKSQSLRRMSRMLPRTFKDIGNKITEGKNLTQPDALSMHEPIHEHESDSVETSPIARATEYAKGIANVVITD